LLRRKMNRPGFLAAIIIVTLAATVARVPSALSDEPPKRIVSLNLCTDQLVMMLVGPERIAAVSHMALDPKLSVLADTAADLPIIYGQGHFISALPSVFCADWVSPSRSSPPRIHLRIYASTCGGWAAFLVYPRKLKRWSQRSTRN
jgi:hypothetical protein